MHQQTKEFHARFSGTNLFSHYDTIAILGYTKQCLTVLLSFVRIEGVWLRSLQKSVKRDKIVRLYLALCQLLAVLYMWNLFRLNIILKNGMSCWKLKMLMKT